MRDYIYIDELRLRRYIDQLPNERKTTFSPTVGVSATGPGLALSASRGPQESNLYRDIERLITYLRDSDLLSALRPNEDEPGPPFVYETMEAERIHLPRRLFEPIESIVGPTEADIWVSDPDEEAVANFKSRPYQRYPGSFLYLIEARWEIEESRHSPFPVSGLSALRLLAHELDIDPNAHPEQEPLGRGSFAHPVDKLQRLFGVRLGTRCISSLYKIRYVSNEQCYTLNGSKQRVYDVLVS